MAETQQNPTLELERKPSANTYKNLLDHGNPEPVHHDWNLEGKKNYMTRLDLIMTILSIFLYPYDIYTDVYLAYIYLVGNWWTQFFLTTFFIVLPSLVTALFRFSGNQSLPHVNTPRLVLDFFATLLQIMPLLASLEYLWYAVNSYFFGKRISFFTRKELTLEWYEERLVWLLTNIAVMRLIESFIEAIPQVSLQLYIVMGQWGDQEGPGGEVSWGVLQSVTTSIISCSWSICFAYKAFVCGSPVTEDAKVSTFGLVLMLVGHLSIISSRLFTLQLLLLTSTTGFFIFCSAHWVFMFTWNVISDFQDQKLSNKFSVQNWISNIIRTFSYIFVYVGLIERSKKFLAVHLIMLMENVVINAVCFSTALNYLGSEISVRAAQSYVVVVPQLVFFIGLVCLQCQTLCWRKGEIDFMKTRKERLNIIKKFVFLLGRPIWFHEHFSSTQEKDTIQNI